MMLKPIFVLTVCAFLAGCVTTYEGGDPVPPKRIDDAAKINAELGLNYLHQGQIPRAKQRLLTAQKQAPNDPLVWSASGYFHESIGEIKEARENYQRAIRLAPRSGEMLNNYGTFLCRQGNYREAITQFNAALKDETYLNKAELYENAGICAVDIPDYSQAERYFLLALEREPNRPKTLLELAEVYEKQGDNEKAYKAIKRYLDIAVPPSVTALNLAIKLAHKMGYSAEAETYRQMKDGGRAL